MDAAAKRKLDAKIKPLLLEFSLLEILQSIKRFAVLEELLESFAQLAIEQAKQYQGKLQEPTFNWLAENLGQITSHYKALRSPAIDQKEE